MRVSFSDDIATFIPDPEGDFEVSDGVWHNYLTVVQAKFDLEEEFVQIEQPPELDEDLEKLRGVLSDEELVALQERRRGQEPVPVEDGPLEEGPIPDAAAPAPVVPGCPKNPSPGGPHRAVSYARHSDGRLLGICKCGAHIQNPDCPHRTQARRGRNVVCVDCGKTIIRNTGYTENDADHPGAVNPAQFSTYEKPH